MGMSTVIINGKGDDMVFEVVVLLITHNKIVEDYIVMKCQDGTVWQYLQYLRGGIIHEILQYLFIVMSPSFFTSYRTT